MQLTHDLQWSLIKHNEGIIIFQLIKSVKGLFIIIFVILMESLRGWGNNEVCCIMVGFLKK